MLKVNSNSTVKQWSTYRYWHITVHSNKQLKWCSDEKYLKQAAQLSQRDRTAWWVSFGQKWKTVSGREYFMDTIGLSSTTVM